MKSLRNVAAIVVITFLFLFYPRLKGLIDFGPQEQAFKIENAEFESVMFTNLTPRTHPVSLHAIKSGKGTILAVRHFHDPSTATHDDEKYWKLTVWIPTLENATYDLTNKNIIAFYTGGSSVWQAFTCWGKLQTGNLTIDKSKNQISIDSKIECPNLKIKYRDIKGTWTLNLIPTGELTYWIGKKNAPSFYKETFPY